MHMCTRVSMSMQSMGYESVHENVGKMHVHVHMYERMHVEDRG